MIGDRVVVARLWGKYTGDVPSRAPIIVDLGEQKYKTICIYLRKKSDEPNYFKSQGFEDFYVAGDKSIGSLNFSVIFKLAGILKEQKVDILHCHRHQAVVYGALAGWIAGTKAVIAHVHGLNRSRTFGRRLINRIVLRRVKKILTVGESVKQDVIKSNPFVPDEKVVSVGNSIDVSRFVNTQVDKSCAKQGLGLNADDYVIGAVGRLEPTKGFDTLIRAFAVFKRQAANAKLVFVGEGSLRQSLESISKQMGVEGSVVFAGRRNDMPDVFCAMDVFVMSSVAEGMPRVLLEAMVSGVPCVATSIGGIPEILDDGKYGLLVGSPLVENLADGIKAVYEMPDGQRQELIENEKNRVLRDYNHDVVTKRVDEIYTEVLAKAN